MIDVIYTYKNSSCYFGLSGIVKMDNCWSTVTMFTKVNVNQNFLGKIFPTISPRMFSVHVHDIMYELMTE